MLIKTKILLKGYGLENNISFSKVQIVFFSETLR